MAKLIETLPIYSDIANVAGSIELWDDGIAVRADRKVKAPYSYVQSLEKIDEVGLGKVSAAMTLYDLLGEKVALKFIINDVNLAKLKKAVGK